jgi:hypothetical protein
LYDKRVYILYSTKIFHKQMIPMFPRSIPVYYFRTVSKCRSRLASLRALTTTTAIITIIIIIITTTNNNNCRKLGSTMLGLPPIA